MPDTDPPASKSKQDSPTIAKKLWQGLTAWMKQNRFALSLFVLGLAVGSCGAVVGFIFYGKSPQHFGVEVGKAIVTLGTGVILGGAVKVMLDKYQAKQEQGARDHELQERLLSDLRNVHDQAETARLTITAHRSAKAYGEQMQHLIACQVVLLKIKRSIDLRPSLHDIDEKAVCLRDMVGYLRALQHEYTRNYSLVADCQRYDTATRRRRLAELTTTNAPFDPRLESSYDAWDMLNDSATFPVLVDFIRCGDGYNARFREPLNQLAASLLRVANPHPNDTQFDSRIEAIAAQVASAGTAVMQQAAASQSGDPLPDTT